MVGFRQIRALVTGHVHGLAGVARHRPRGRLARGPYGTRGGFRRFVRTLGGRRAVQHHGSHRNRH